MPVYLFTNCLPQFVREVENERMCASIQRCLYHTPLYQIGFAPYQTNFTPYQTNCFGPIDIKPLMPSYQMGFAPYRHVFTPYQIVFAPYQSNFTPYQTQF